MIDDREGGASRSADNTDIRSIPRIAIQAFCESPDVAAVLEQASTDRRMAKTHVKIHMGGIDAAIDFYSSAPTPNLLLVETRERREQALAQIARLAGVCDAGTKVILIGHYNDVVLYRELLRRGVSDYMVVPFDLYDVIREIGDLYLGSEVGPVGRAIAFVGAKGGSGSSTVAHNVGFALSRAYEADVLVADLDLAWGTAGLDFNQDPPQTVADAIQSPERIDDVFLDRILAKCANNLSLLAAPATLERTYDHDEATFDTLIDTVRSSMPSVVLDLPHQWSGWIRRVLSLVDDVVITATPDLASLRNTKNLVDQLKLLRPNDRECKIVVNQVGVPKRPEIKPEDFRKALSVDLVATIPFDPALFGNAANNGQMIAEINAKSPVAEIFADVARQVMGRAEVRKAKKSPLAPLLARLPIGKRKSG